MYSRLPVWAPSPVADPLFREVPKEVDRAEIAEIVAGYGLVANRHDPDTVDEFYLFPDYRPAALPLFRQLLEASRATKIRAQTNDRLMLLMLYDCAQNITSDTTGREPNHHETRSRARGAGGAQRLDSHRPVVRAGGNTATAGGRRPGSSTTTPDLPRRSAARQRRGVHRLLGRSLAEQPVARHGNENQWLL